MTNHNTSTGTTTERPNLDSFSIRAGEVYQNTVATLRGIGENLAARKARVCGSLAIVAGLSFTGACSNNTPVQKEDTPTTTTVKNEKNSSDDQTGSSEEMETANDPEVEAQNEALLQRIEEEAAQAIVKENPRIGMDEAREIAAKRQGAWFEMVEQRSAIEGALNTEISDDEAAVLSSLGLAAKDYTAVEDPEAPLPGPKEASGASFNGGKTVQTPLESVEQLTHLLGAEGSFTEEQAAVVKEALQNNGAPQTMLDELAEGDVSNIGVSFVTLNSPSAEYENIGFNKGGKLSYDELRDVGAEDALGLITYTDANGDTYVSAYRTDCGWQPFQKVNTPKEAPAPAPTPEVEAPTPSAPAPPKADTPAPGAPSQPKTPEAPATPEAPPEEFTYTTSVCVELLPNGEERHELFTGNGSTEAEAKADAERQANDAKADCTPEETPPPNTSTTTPATTTTGAPTTLPPIEVTTTTGVTVTSAPPTTQPPVTTAPPTTQPPVTTAPPTTQPPKNCENNPVFCPTTTVPPTIPEDPTETRPPATALGFARTQVKVKAEEAKVQARTKFSSFRRKADARLGKLVADAVQSGFDAIGNSADIVNPTKS